MPRGATAKSRTRILGEWDDYGMPTGLTAAGTPMPLYVSGTGVLGVDLLSEAISVAIENVHIKTITGATPLMDDTDKLAVSAYGQTAASPAGRTSMLMTASGAQYVWLASALDALTDDIAVTTVGGATPTFTGGAQHFVLTGVSVSTTSTIKWTTYPAASPYFTTELDSLAEAGNKLGGAISASGNVYMDAVLYAATANTRAATDYVSLYFLPSVDGTNYPFGSDTVNPGAGNLVGTFNVTAGTPYFRSTLTHLLAPAGMFKMLVENNAGAALAATGNKLDHVFYSEKVV